MPEHFDPPWESPAWRAEARAWIEAALAANGSRLSAELDPFHIRPWSTVMRVPTDNGPLYFKAGAPTQAFEPALLQRLYALQPDTSLPVLAADEARGWALLPDGGPTLRQALNDQFDRAAWQRMLAAYARLQIELAPHAEALLSAGVPDRRPAQLPAFFGRLVAAEDLMQIGEPGGLTLAQAGRFRALGPRVEALAAQLDAYGLPASLDHGDLHDANVFLHGEDFTFFDWGDASLTHPFISLMVPLRVLGNHLGYEPETHPDLAWAREAYLQPWTAFAPMPDLIAAWEIALRLGRFQRAITWFAITEIVGLEILGEYAESYPAWLLEFIEDAETGA